MPDEVEDLKAMFATPARSLSPPRESALPLTRIAKFSVADENSRLAAQGRLEKEARLRQREQDEQNRLSKALTSQAEVMRSRELAKLHQDLTKEKNQNLVRSIRATEAEWQVEREQANEGFRNEARKRVLIANALDARLDAQEEAVDAQERAEGTAMRQEVMRQVEETREKNLLQNRENAVSMRTSTERAVAEATSAAMLAKKKQADAKRRDAEELKVEKEHLRQVQMTRASVGKQAVRAGHEIARALACARARALSAEGRRPDAPSSHAPLAPTPRRPHAPPVPPPPSRLTGVCAAPPRRR